MHTRIGGGGALGVPAVQCRKRWRELAVRDVRGAKAVVRVRGCRGLLRYDAVSLAGAVC